MSALAPQNEPPPDSDAGNYALLDQLAAEYAERLRKGERPELREYIDRHPDLAREIHELFPAMVEIERADDRSQSDRHVDPDFSAQVPSQVGDYRILREIGRGGMGIVYEAEQLSLGRHVALKVMLGGWARAGSHERFRREARAAARLHHTNIVPVYEVGRDRDVAYYAMQFIQGQGVDLVIAELKRLRDRSRGPVAAPARTERSRFRSIRRAPRGRRRRRQTVSHVRQRGERHARPLSQITDGLLAGRLTAQETGLPKTERLPGPTIDAPGALDDRPRLPAARACGRRVGIALERHRRAIEQLGRPAGRRAALELRRTGQADGPLSQCGPDWPPGRRGTRLRARPGHRSPRHQAVEPAPGHVRCGLDHRLRPGQGRRRGLDPYRRRHWHRPIHGA